MRYHTVGEAIAFSNTFFDANDVETTVPSATITIVYPTLGPSGNLLSQDPGQLKAVQTITMTAQSDGSWLANWDSSVSSAGQVYYCMVGGGIVEEGVIVLRANLATMQAFPQPVPSIP
jgi:hypothetical protein